VNKELAKLNLLAGPAVNEIFMACCGSRKWSEQMGEKRPFESVESLISSASELWFRLEQEDWLEAFAAHPRIGEKKAAPAQNALAAAWSGKEQSTLAEAADSVLSSLEEANRLYYEKFGFIFIVCATGKSADEMLRMCRARLVNDAPTELKTAAIEQSKITEIRLKKFFVPESL
jgi:OHCU decarboxylase